MRQKYGTKATLTPGRGFSCRNIKIVRLLSLSHRELRDINLEFELIFWVDYKIVIAIIDFTLILKVSKWNKTVYDYITCN